MNLTTIMIYMAMYVIKVKAKAAMQNLKMSSVLLPYFHACTKT